MINNELKKLLSEIDLKEFRYKFECLHNYYYEEDFKYDLKADNKFLLVDFTVYGYVVGDRFIFRDLCVNDIEIYKEEKEISFNDKDILDVQLELETKLKEIY
jgi:hypothetical protein